MAKKQTKEINPLLKRIGTNPATAKAQKAQKAQQQKQGKAVIDKRLAANPLFAALHKAKAKANNTQNKKKKKEIPLADQIRSYGKKTTTTTNTTNTKSKTNQPQTKQNKSRPKTSKRSFTFSSKVTKPTSKTHTFKSQPQQTNVLKIKDEPVMFLRVRNLEIGTSVNNLQKVLHTMGNIMDIRVQDLPSGSTTAEIVFNSIAQLKKADIALNGAIADGRVIQTEISSVHQIG